MFGTSVGARFTAATTAALLVLAGCGGGADPPPAAPALRAQAGALSAGPVSAQASAEMLMDVAEGRYSQFFPGHPATQSMSPFAFRHYPTTGIHLGVVVAAGTEYELNGVYAMGGPFGAAPTYLGPLSAFITPVDLSAGGIDNGCYDLSIYDSSGRQVRVSQAFSGSESAGTTTIESQIGAVVDFQGRPSRETASTTTTSYTSSPIYPSVFTTIDEARNYTNHTGDGELTYYGYAFTYQTTRSPGLTLSGTTLYSPPYAERRYRLAIGESAAQTFSSSTTNYPGGPSVQQTFTRITTYAGRETITVPAGTYETCKFETVTPSTYQASIVTDWVIVGQGLLAKRVLDFGAGSSHQTTMATSIMVNGQPL